MWKNKKLLPVNELGAFKRIAWGFLFMLAGVAALYYGNIFVSDISRRFADHSLGRQLFGSFMVFFVHGLQILLLFLAWIATADGIARYFGRFELAVGLLTSSVGIWAACSVFPVLSDFLAYSFPVNFYVYLLLVILFQVLTSQVDNGLDKSAAMMLWVYSFQSLELFPTYLADGHAALLLFSGVLRTNEEAAIVSIAGTSLFMSLMAGAVISTWVLASYSVKLNQVRRLWDEQPRDREEDKNEGLRQVNMVDIRNLVHDLKNPLAAVKGMALMLRDAPNIGGGSEKLDIMLKAANYMERMIGEILHEDQLHEVQIESFFDRLTNHIQPFPWGRDVTVSIGPDAARETVAVNEIRFTRAMLNVLDNAWRANRIAGAKGIEVRIRRSAQFIEIEILDNGPGVTGNPAHKTLPHPKSGWGSTGLGLAFARKVMALHGGNLMLSQRMDAPNGASVVISLPAKNAASPQF